jgi:hypothetical protein
LYGKAEVGARPLQQAVPAAAFVSTDHPQRVINYSAISIQKAFLNADSRELSADQNEKRNCA